VFNFLKRDLLFKSESIINISNYKTILRTFNNSQSKIGVIKIQSEIAIPKGHMKKLTSYQKKYLRGLAHNLKPVVFIGQKGMTDQVASSTDEALNAHELIKVKFNEFKKKVEKMKIAELIETGTGCQLVGIIGHVAIFYRRHGDPEKRKIKIPTTRP